MINEKDETEQRTRRTAGTAGMMGTAATVGVAAGVAAGALLDEATEPDEATHAPAARDPFDDLVPPPPAAPPVAAEADTSAATAEARSVIDTDDSVNPVVTPEVVEPVVTEKPGVAEVTVEAVTAPATAAPIVVDEPAPAVIAAEPAPVEEPVAEEPVAPPPAAPPPADPAPVAAEEPVTAEEPVAVGPAITEPPVLTEPPASSPPEDGFTPGAGMEPGGTSLPPEGGLDPITGLPHGGGPEPMSGWNGTDEILGTGEPITVTPLTPVAPDPVTITSNTPDPVMPEPELVTGSGVVPLTPPLIEIEVFDGPPPDMSPNPQIAIDVLNRAGLMMNERVQLFGKLSMQDIDNDDKIELWRALKQLNPTLQGGPRELQGAVVNDWTLEKVASAYGVNLAQLAMTVQLENNENINMEAFAQQAGASNVMLQPHVVSVEVDGYVIEFSANGEVTLRGEEEEAFQTVDFETVIEHSPAPGIWASWMFYIDDEAVTTQPVD